MNEEAKFAITLMHHKKAKHQKNHVKNFVKNTSNDYIKFYSFYPKFRMGL